MSERRLCIHRYTDQDYDSEFIQVLQTQCFKFIKQEGDPTLEDVSTFIHDKVCVITCLKASGSRTYLRWHVMWQSCCLQGISRVQLRDEDVMMILNTLEYDGQIEKIDSPDGEDRFRQALLAIPETSAFTSIPCGVCSVSFYAKPSTLIVLFSSKSAVTEFVAVAEL